jgi:hypothetical protein
MAKKGSDEKKEEAAKPSEVSQQTGKRKLKELLGTARDAYKDGRSIAGALGQAIKEAVEHNYLHAKAFKSVVAEDRMTPEKLADFYAAQEYYRDVLGLNERAASAPRLGLEEKGEAEEEGEEEGEKEGEKGNVQPFPTPAGRA